MNPAPAPVRTLAPSRPRRGRGREAAGLLVVALVAAGVTAARPRNARPPATPTRIEYSGTLLYEAHFRRPGDVHPYHSHQVYSTDHRGNARLDWTNWEEGDSVFVPETFLVSGGRAFHRDAPGQPWVEYTGARARDARLQACAGLPASLLRLSAAGRGERESWVKARGRISGYTRLKPHPRLGDVRDSVAYRWGGAEPAPEAMSMALYERDSNWRLFANRVAWSSDALPDSLFAVPEGATPAAHRGEEDTLGTVPPLVALAPGIWSADLADIDSRTLVVEFVDHVAVIETAVGSANGERIVDAIRRQFPGKPVRDALFSHYHPHYTGGLRALIAEGATVITTPGNEAFVHRIAAYPFRMRPDRLARHPRAVRTVVFANRYEIADSTNRLVAINYGVRSQHTDEFVLFWFPRQKLLFESEQGWSRVNGAPRTGRRAKALMSWVAEQGLDVERVVQGWPMRDTDAMLTRATLDSLVQAPR